MSDERIYRGYRRCSRIEYDNPANAFAITICVKPKRQVFCEGDRSIVAQEEIQRLQHEGILSVFVYCIMPDHVHLVASSGSVSLSDAVKRFKGRLAAWWRTHGDGLSLWQRSFFDHRIRSSEGFREKCDYVLANPVRAGLCESAEAYEWCGVLAAR